MKPVIICTFFVVITIAQYVDSYGVLHKILKIDENAYIDDVKVAYEKLLKQWYKASRTLSTEAEILHLKIVQAYHELRSQMEVDFHEKHIISSEYYKSAIQSLGIEVLHSISVPLNSYYAELLKRSNTNLHLVLFYTVNSSTTRIIHNWFNLVDILTPLGVVTVTINMDNEVIETATSIIGESPSSFPYLILLIEGVAIPYNSDEFIDFMIMDFIRRNLPSDLLRPITDISIHKFLNLWRTNNKVRALIFQPTLPVRLQYLLTAYLHQKNVIFGFVNTGGENTREIQKRMNISSSLDTFVLFKENLNEPCVKINVTPIPVKLLNDTISKNQFLTLPRITSQEMFDSICPASSHALIARLCVILVIQNSLEHQKYDPKMTFRRFIEEYSSEVGDISFMYIYRDYQPGFILPIKETVLEEFGKEPYVVALQKLDGNHVKYALLMKNYQNWDDYENTKNRLKAAIESVRKSGGMMFLDTFKLNEFVDESPPSLFNRILRRLRSYVNKITLENMLPYMVSASTVIYFFVYFTSHWNKFQCLWNALAVTEDTKSLKLNEDKKPLQPGQKKQHTSPEVFLKNGKCITSSRELRLHELKAETYNGMVRLLKPGCRTIILMFDRVRADLLVSQFYKAVWPYRKNKNLLFGYVNMEKKATLEWYSELVKACLPEQQDIEINPYFCAGTVLALSGMRKYFCLYHLKHPGIMPSKEKAEMSVTAAKTTFSDEELLVGLREWLDKLFDGSGSVIRYRVNHWPEFKIL